MKLNLLIVPDKFKGTLTAKEAASIISQGWCKIRPNDVIKTLPMCDGGDGFAEVLAQYTAAKKFSAVTVDAAHNRLSAPWWYDANNNTAIIETAKILGLSMHPEGKYHPFQIDSRGLGIILNKIASKGVRRAHIGLGGSSINDGAYGMARAIGWQFLDRKRNVIDKWTDLRSLVFLNSPAKPVQFDEIIAASDVQNPLLGRYGASCIYGPQKGLLNNEIPIAERALRRFSQVVAETIGEDFSKQPGAGAAGGLGFGLMAFLGAKTQSGFEIFANYSNLKNHLQWADMVVTGEGQIDASTFMGKCVGRLTVLANQQGIPCIGLCGRKSGNIGSNKIQLLNHVHCLDELTTLSEAKSKSKYWLGILAARAASHVTSIPEKKKAMFKTKNK